MSRTYRRKNANPKCSSHRGFVEEENEYIVGGYTHHVYKIDNSLDYHRYKRREEARFHSDGYHTCMNNAPSWWCNIFNRTERRACSKQLHHQLRYEYEDVDVRLVCGPFSATWEWW